MSDAWFSFFLASAGISLLPLERLRRRDARYGPPITLTEYPHHLPEIR